MNPSDIEFVAIGRIISTWGNRGGLKVELLTDFPERFETDAEVFIDRRPAVVRSLDWSKGYAIIHLDISRRPEDAERLRGRLIEIPADRVEELPEGTYYHFQLLGLEVVTTGGETVGKITDIKTAAGMDTYVVSAPGGDVLIPAARDIIREVDIEKGRLVIEPIKGLLDLNKKAAD